MWEPVPPTFCVLVYLASCWTWLSFPVPMAFSLLVKNQQQMVLGSQNVSSSLSAPSEAVVLVISRPHLTDKNEANPGRGSVLS